MGPVVESVHGQWTPGGTLTEPYQLPVRATEMLN